MKKPVPRSASVRKPALQAARKTPRKAAKKVVAKKAAKKVAKKAAKKATATARPPQGPLTLEQAQAIAGGPPPERAAGTRGAARARARALSATAAAPPTPETVENERKRLRKLRETEDKERIKHYKTTMSLMQRRGVRGIATPGTRAAAAGPLRILAEGDSWFDYPVPFFGGGIITRLEKKLGVPILNLAKAGDEVRFMLGVEERLEIINQLKAGSPAGGAWDVMLFSGGGNDVVDNPMVLWLNRFKPGMTAPQLINQPRYDHALGMIRAGYEDLIALRDALSPGTHLVFHAYDFALPDGRGVCGKGPWIKPSLDVKGVPANSTVAKDLVKELLKQFALMIDGLANSHPGITFINGQGTLQPVPASWHNELHPERAGFEKFAELFRAKLKALFPSRVP